MESGYQRILCTHLVLSGVKVQVSESRNWHTGILVVVSELFHHIELQARYVCEPEECKTMLEILFND